MSLTKIMRSYLPRLSPARFRRGSGERLT